jgi:phenylpyruvate tautomerase PptA (4-oxalocrotonate tautomerase family)
MYPQDDLFSNGNGIVHDNIPRLMITQLHFNMITIQHTPPLTSKQHDYYYSIAPSHHRISLSYRLFPFQKANFSILFSSPYPLIHISLSSHSKMPLWTIYHPPSTFTLPSQKSALSSAITSIYTAASLPPFYVVIIFQPIAPADFYVGGIPRPSPHTPSNEPGPDSSKPFIRITVQNIARKL